MRPSRGFRPLIKASTQAYRSSPCSRQWCLLTERNYTTSLQSRSWHNQPICTSIEAVCRPDATREPQSQRRHASSSSELKHTPLYAEHANAGAKMGPFAGFSMPLEYPDQSHPESHKWTRENASLFDVSHMVQHKLSGPLAEEFLMTITPSSINTLSKHSSTLSCLLDDDGGIIDDTVITRLGRDSFYFVTNAGCRDTDIPYLDRSMSNFLHAKEAANDQITWHVLDHHALLALQGPKAVEVLEPLIFRDPEDDTLDTDLSTLGFGQSRWFQLTLPDDTNTPSLLISRTGYTGEDGFEISIPPENGDSTNLATSIANAFLADKAKVRWAGLAARDSLRLEAGMCLYGHDITTDTTPPMAALGWIVGKDRRDPDAAIPFKGISTILEHLAKPSSMTQRRVGFLVEKGPAAREGADIVDPDSNEVIGKITSGCPSPTMDGQNIAMGLIKNGYHKKGTKVGVKVRKGLRKAEVAKMPFVDNKFYRPDLKGKGKDEAQKEQ